MTQKHDTDICVPFRYINKYIDDVSIFGVKEENKWQTMEKKHLQKKRVSSEWLKVDLQWPYSYRKGVKQNSCVHCTDTVFRTSLPLSVSLLYTLQNLPTLCATKDIMEKSWLTCRHDIYLFAATRKHFDKHDNNINVDIQYLTAKALLSEKQTLPVIIHPAHNYN